MKTFLKLIIVLFLLSQKLTFGQTAEVIKQQILPKTNVNNLKDFALKQNSLYIIQKEEATRKAIENGWPIRQEINGVVIELQGIDDTGMPMYYITNNSDAALTTSTNKLYNGGGLGLSLSGTNMKAGVWDGGTVLTTHQEFNNTGSARVVNIDASATHYHATHVTGTIVAGGVQANAKGMAYNATADAYDWNNDLAQMTTAAANGLLISNHSYGNVVGWAYGNWSGTEAWHWFGTPSISQTEDWRFGFYDSRSASTDNLARNAPYYLIVKSAGNDAGQGPASGTSHYVNPGSGWELSNTTRDLDGGTNAYDCIPTWGNAKNILTIGAVHDITGGYSQASDVVIASFSGRGPTDDGRIKPDIVGNGIGLYSTYNGHDQEYASISGTSMSSPNVTGSLLLLQEHYYNLHNNYMMAATLKALAIHTAYEAGLNEGPDYYFGWGLLNAASAANVVTDKDMHTFIKEETLNNGNTYTLQLSAKGTEPLVATIVWADPEGTPTASSLNPTTKMLVNDLDIRISYDGTTFYPYKLDRQNPANAATKEDNDVDNVEKVYIATPLTEVYTLTVTHKGSLSGGSQDFSLIVTGITNGLPVVTTDDVNNIAFTSADIDATVISDGGNSVTERGVVFNTTGMPYTTDNKVISGNGTGSFTTTINNLQSATTYYVRAYAINTDGVSYGNQMTFTTNCLPETVFPFLEDFTGVISCPNCWEIIDHEGNNQVWQFGSFISPYGDNFNTNGNYVYLNSDGYGEGNSQNVDLISPMFDFSGYNNINLSFIHFFRRYDPSETASISYSLNNGSSWTQIQQWNNTTSNAATFNQTISALANESQVKFKWHYDGSWGYYWCIDDIQVTATATNSLTVSNTTHVVNTNMAYQDVTIAHDGKLTVEVDKILTVTGDFSIESNATGTGSFLQNGVLHVAGNIQTEKYLPNTTQTGWTLSVPVVNADETVFNGADDIWYYNSALPAWQQFTSGTLSQMTAYVVRFPNTETIVFDGAFNNGTMVRNDLVRTTSPSNYGWNYIGNPYPSPIDWEAPSGISYTNLNNAIYYRKHDGNVASYVSGVGTNGGSNIIPAMQAFWVQVSAGESTASLELNNESRLHDNNNIYKTLPSHTLKLKLSNNNFTDETVIRFHDEASQNFDNKYDAYKMLTQNISLPQLYTTNDNEIYAINTLPLPTQSLSVPVVLSTEESGVYEIIAENVSSFEQTHIILEDLYENKFIDLNEEQVYNFNLIKGLTVGRFLIHFNPMMAYINDIDKLAHIYTYSQSIYITSDETLNHTVEVYDMMGKLLHNEAILNKTLHKINADWSAGQYIVKLTGSEYSITKKVLIQ